MESQVPAPHPMQQQAAQPAVAFRSYLRSVFSWMIGGVFLTGLIAFWLQDSMAARISSGTMPGWWFWAAIIAQLAAVMTLSWGINKISAGLATLLFVGYAALTGVTFAMIFAMYSDAEIFGAFFATAAMFAALAGIGYTTKADLTKWGPFLFAGLIGILVGGLIGMFFSMAIYNIVFIWGGLIVFMGLTIYEVNQMKRQNLAGMDDTTLHKATIIGALSLYLNFINIFIRLLAIFGGNR